MFSHQQIPNKTRDKFEELISQYTEDLLRQKSTDFSNENDNSELAFQYQSLISLNQDIDTTISDMQKQYGSIESHLKRTIEEYKTIKKESESLAQLAKSLRLMIDSNPDSGSILDKSDKIYQKKQEIISSLKKLLKDSYSLIDPNVDWARHEINSYISLIQSKSEQLKTEILMLRFLLNENKTTTEKTTLLHDIQNENVVESIRIRINQMNSQLSKITQASLQHSTLSKQVQAKKKATTRIVRPFNSKNPNLVMKLVHNPNKITNALLPLALKQSKEIPNQENFDDDQIENEGHEKSQIKHRHTKKRRSSQSSLSTNAQNSHIRNSQSLIQGLYELFQSNQKEVVELKNKITEIEQIRNELQEKVELFQSKRPKCDLYNPTFTMTLAGENLQKTKAPQNTNSRFTQTDVTGETIEFHTRILENQRKERSDAEVATGDIASMKEEIKKVRKKLEIARAEKDRRDTALQKAAEQVEELEDRIKNDQLLQDQEAQMKVSIVTDINNLKTQIREKQAKLQQISDENTKVNGKLDDLLHKKKELENDIEELAFKEKPQIEELSDKVQAIQRHVGVSKQKLLKAKEELEKEKERLNLIQNSQEYAQYKTLYLRKKVLERRIMKWKLLIKASGETMQSLEQFSSDNIERRRNLKETVEKYEESKFVKEKNLAEVEQFSALLDSLVLEQKKNT